MASDIAEMFKQNFLEFVQDNDQLKLSPTITSILADIKTEFTENEGYWSPPPVESLSYFYQLDHILSECQANKRSLLSRLDPVQRSIERTLNDIKGNLIQTRDNIMQKINTDTAYSTSKLFSSSMYPTRKDAPMSGVFEEEIEKIVTWLEPNDGFKAIGVHGMCGTGKTTLVKMVLDDQRVKKKFMNRILWVCLYDLTSVEEMDIRIVKEMLAQLDDDPDLLMEEPEDGSLVERLYDKLKIKGGRYLIVLDGVWHYNKWFNNLYDDVNGAETKRLLFSHALPKEGSGCAVIVTSRQKEVTNVLVNGKNLIHLKPWDDEKLKEFVKQCLAKEGKSEMSQKKIDLIAYHCHGLPLVAEFLSGWIAEQIPD
ncbi:hypothetical protein Fmac_027014 [Flemingia macrophylla]|uniref:NB-ARC domain-containing protein n=1 Tax=Flemingia macrophylla TaxID=520843 RepID=A0ABD1LGI7_9FABA